MCRAAVPCKSSSLSGNVFYSFLKYFCEFEVTTLDFVAYLKGVATF